MTVQRLIQDVESCWLYVGNLTDMQLAGDQQIAEKTERKHVKSQQTQLDTDYAPKKPAEKTQLVYYQM